MTIKTIFLDRDGVINKEINYLYKIEDFEFTDGIFKACKYFQKLGFFHLLEAFYPQTPLLDNQ